MAAAEVRQIKAVRLGEKGAQFEEVEPGIQALLDHYSSLFHEPKGVALARAHNHKIPILSSHGLVSVWPYEYPFYQKKKK